jgi:hypothetical protein
MTDSSRSDRTDLWNANARNNLMGGERITDCDLADTIVACSGNV